MTNFISILLPLVGSQYQADAICSDLTNAFVVVPHTISLRKLNALGFSGGYINWFRSYLTNRQRHARVSGILSSPFQVLPGVSQGYVLGRMLLNAFIKDLCNAIKYSGLFAHDIKIFR
jgi:hypothetical protein